MVASYGSLTKHMYVGSKFCTQFIVDRSDCDGYVFASTELLEQVLQEADHDCCIKVVGQRLVPPCRLDQPNSGWRPAAFNWRTLIEASKGRKLADQYECLVYAMSTVPSWPTERQLATAKEQGWLVIARLMNRNQLNYSLDHKFELSVFEMVKKGEGGSTAGQPIDLLIMLLVSDPNKTEEKLH